MVLYGDASLVEPRTFELLAVKEAFFGLTISLKVATSSGPRNVAAGNEIITSLVSVLVASFVMVVSMYSVTEEIIANVLQV